MKTYTFHEGSLPPHVTFHFESAFFNGAKFRHMYDPAHWLSFYILNERFGKVDAELHFYRDGSSARSPFKAPFGSIDSEGHIPPAVLFEFLGFVESRLKSVGVREVFIKNPPRVYAPDYLSLLETFLLNNGYTIADAETSVVMAIDERPFVTRIRHSEILRYRQAMRAGLICREINADRIEEVYSFISRCHVEKRYTISITKEALKKSVDTFPDRYVLFGVFEGDQIRGASVSIRVKNNILYNFLVNHERQYNSLSPPVLLMEALYNYCRDNEIWLLDLGTSALHRRPNFSLLNFKLHMGGTPTTKLSFSKKIA